MSFTNNAVVSCSNEIGEGQEQLSRAVLFDDVADYLF